MKKFFVRQLFGENVHFRNIRIVSTLCAMLISLCINSHAHAAFVQYEAKMDYPATVGRITLNNVRAGSLLIVAVRLSVDGSTTVTSPGAVWTRDIHQVHSLAGVQMTLDIHSAPNVPGGTTNINVNVTGGSTSVRMLALEFSGMSTSSPAIDASSNDSTNQPSGQSSSVNAGTVTTGVDGTLLFGVAATNSDLQGWVGGNNFTMINQCNVNQEPDQKICTEYRGLVDAGTYSGNFTINSDYWAAGIVAYAPAESSSPPPPLKVPNPPMIQQVN